MAVRTRRAPGTAPPRRVRDAELRRALDEDEFRHDVTSQALFPAALPARADIVAQSAGVLSGVALAARTARLAGVQVRRRSRDGSRLRAGQSVLELSGDLRRILAVERTLLNLLMHLSGVATATHRAVVAGAPLRVYATRKTLPGLRDAEKAAVIDGGGAPHRRDLSSDLLVKSTHLEYLPIGRAVERARAASRGRPVQVEVSSAAAAMAAARAGADSLLIDNRSPAQVRAIVRALEGARLRGALWIELSGGITPVSIRRYRRTGADAASLGSLTHSAPALPFHLVVRRRVVARGRAPR